MDELIVKKEHLPQRCDICHKSDLYDAEKNFCQRCNALITKEESKAEKRAAVSFFTFVRLSYTRLRDLWMPHEADKSLFIIPFTTMVTGIVGFIATFIWCFYLVAHEIPLFVIFYALLIAILGGAASVPVGIVLGVLLWVMVRSNRS
jgi:hypothetical protein